MLLKSNYLTTPDGTSLHYITAGKKQSLPLMFFHGNNGSWEFFQNQLDYFSKDYFVIAMDSRNQGQTKSGLYPFHFDNLVEDIQLILQKEQLTKVVLIGFSDGANLALKYTHRHPENVLGLVFNAGNLVPFGLKPIGNILTQLQVLISKFFSHFSQKWKRRFSVYQLMTYPLFLSLKDLQTITVPTLVVIGQYDFVSLRHATKIAEALPLGQLTVVKKAWHNFAKTKPEIFNQLVKNFIKESVIREKN